MRERVKTWAEQIFADPARLDVAPGDLDLDEILADPEQFFAALNEVILSQPSVTEYIQMMRNDPQMGFDEPAGTQAAKSFDRFYSAHLVQHVSWDPEDGDPPADRALQVVEDCLFVMYLAQQTAHPDLQAIQMEMAAIIERQLDEYLDPGYDSAEGRVLDRTLGGQQARDYARQFDEMRTALGNYDVEGMQSALLRGQHPICMSMLGYRAPDIDQDLPDPLPIHPSALLHMGNDGYLDTFAIAICEALCEQEDFEASNMYSFLAEWARQQGRRWPTPGYQKLMDAMHSDPKILARILAHARAGIIATAFSPAPSKAEHLRPLQYSYGFAHLRGFRAYQVWAARPELLAEIKIALEQTLDAPSPLGMGTGPKDLWIPLDVLDAGPLHTAAEHPDLLGQGYGDYLLLEGYLRPSAKSGSQALARAARILQNEKLLEKPRLTKANYPASTPYALVHASWRVVQELVEKAGHEACFWTTLDAFDEHARDPETTRESIPTVVYIPVQASGSGVALVMREYLDIDLEAKFNIPRELITPSAVGEILIDIPLALHDKYSSQSNLNPDAVRELVADGCDHPYEQLSFRLAVDIHDTAARAPEPTMFAPAGVLVDCDCCGRTRLAAVAMHEIESLWPAFKEGLIERGQAGIYLAKHNYERALQGQELARDLDQLYELSAERRMSSYVEVAKALAPTAPQLRSLTDSQTLDPQDHYEGFTL